MSAEPCLVEIEPEPEPAPGDVIAGKYRIERVIGKGGMGIVVAAMHEHLRERVAIKLIWGGSGMEAEDAIARFLREARAVVKIKSPYVARLFDVDTLGSGMPYMVMEYLEGRDLAKELYARGPLPIEEAVDYVIQICLGLAPAHELGVVHRDLKLSNLFLVYGARGTKHIKVLDFGISKILDGSSVDGAEAVLTAPHSVMGSPSYMSPEQIRDAKHVDQRADIWSLGVILHELLAGRRPFSGLASAAILASICADPPAPILSVRPDVPAELARVIESCLEKLRDRRPESVGVVQERLLPFASARMQSICAHGGEMPLSRPSEPARSDRWGLNQSGLTSSERMVTRNERAPKSSNASAPLSWIEPASGPTGDTATRRDLSQTSMPDEKVHAPGEGLSETPRAPAQRVQRAAMAFMAGIIALLTVSVVVLVTRLERPQLSYAQAGVLSAPESKPRELDAAVGINAPTSAGDVPVSIAPGASASAAAPEETAMPSIPPSKVSAKAPTLSEAAKLLPTTSSTSTRREESGGEVGSPRAPEESRPRGKTGPPSAEDGSSRH